MKDMVYVHGPEDPWPTESGQPKLNDPKVVFLSEDNGIRVVEIWEAHQPEEGEENSGEFYRFLAVEKQTTDSMGQAAWVPYDDLLRSEDAIVELVDILLSGR